jgi:PPOX class probable F420-dependent enzyme
MTATIAGSTPSDATIDLDTARFIELVTFRRTGQPVGTPVLFVPDGDRLLVRTAHDSGKLKRLAHTAEVAVTPADSRGRHRGITRSGTARVLGPEAVAPALARLHARHRVAGPLFTALRRLRRQGDVIVEVRLDAVP